MVKWFFNQIGLARIVALFLVAFAIWVRIQDPYPVEVVRNLTFDVFQQLKPREYQPVPVAILDVDDASITEIGQWPWPRTRFADLVDKSMQAGAMAVAFDVIFAEPDRLSPDRIAQDNPDLPPSIATRLAELPRNDLLLAEAFSRGRVIVGQTSVRSALSDVKNTQEIAQVRHAIIGPDPRPFLQNYPDLITNLPPLEQAATGRGMFTVRPDPDGVYRQVPIVMAVGGELRMGLAPELLRIATGGRPFTVRSNDAGVEAVVLAGQAITTAQNGTVLPYLTPSRPGRLISAADLLMDRVPPGRLQGHLLLVGTSAIGLEDYRATSLGVQMPGVEIHAQLLENILTQSLLQRHYWTVGAEIATAATLCLLIVILAPIMNAIVLIVSTLITLTAIVWGAFLYFERNLTLFDPSFVVVSALATIMFMSATNYLREEQRRRQIRDAFGQYVSKDLVAEISENQDKLTLGGERRELTLLFSDVRGFTAIAEGFRDNPAGLTTLMNRFLNLLSEAILERNGTIDKFMGDAVMAFWNAPLDHDDHARAACAAALRMKHSVDDLNKARELEAQKGGYEHLPINIGIGVNTGSCVVGNMGSDNRFDYTAMGDPVNLASRLEGQTRYYGTSIICGTSTAEVVRGDFALLELDLIRVKGKSQPERIFAVLGGEAMRNSAEFSQAEKLNAQMLEAYRAQDWDRAEGWLDELTPIATRLDPLLLTSFSFLRDRLKVMRELPKDPDWNGVYDATSK